MGPYGGFGATNSLLPVEEHFLTADLINYYNLPNFQPSYSLEFYHFCTKLWSSIAHLLFQLSYCHLAIQFFIVLSSLFLYHLGNVERKTYFVKKYQEEISHLVLLSLVD